MLSPPVASAARPRWSCRRPRTGREASGAAAASADEDSDVGTAAGTAAGADVSAAAPRARPPPPPRDASRACPPARGGLLDERDRGVLPLPSGSAGVLHLPLRLLRDRAVHELSLGVAVSGKRHSQRRNASRLESLSEGQDNWPIGRRPWPSTTPRVTSAASLQPPVTVRTVQRCVHCSAATARESLGR